ncbi:hypothetical protein JANAI62_01760 [Jannaschia pagri]|uniref:N-acetyltransferase domain-containing protein n=1 Tax=Jannaschia pagri TaxID=2829797 RepID=A0ABQ4NGK1_9RHOB|nr:MULTISPECIES: GNAT family N-acetyltransferase [unclassified Jannaschia]GIT90341.1 hypothetical protein JANAI61_07990 [Jannaschia sp. AI_61]GIT93553.1 hypothetical protein JANAI62_01760 [Jannaschia sp. AI_62]
MTPLREVRTARPADMPALAEIFWAAVQRGAAPHYTQAQRDAWLPRALTAEEMAQRVAGQLVLVAEDHGQVAGFMSLRADGYLDLAYVLPEMRGTGLAGMLLAVVENQAYAAKLDRLSTRASALACPFFARHGWQVVAPAPQVRAGITLPATDMIRLIAPAFARSA